MGFEYTKKAKDTMYGGCLFRSRLEATWAAFFDICGIKWVYEPFDLPGWSPDFLIQDKALVEVKPFTIPDEDLQRKIISSKPKHSVFFLGPSPINDYTIGWAIESCSECESYEVNGEYFFRESGSPWPEIGELVVRGDGRIQCSGDSFGWETEEGWFPKAKLNFTTTFNEAKNKVRFTVR